MHISRVTSAIIKVGRYESQICNDRREMKKERVKANIYSVTQAPEGEIRQAQSTVTSENHGENSGIREKTGTNTTEQTQAGENREISGLQAFGITQERCAVCKTRDRVSSLASCVARLNLFLEAYVSDRCEHRSSLTLFFPVTLPHFLAFLRFALPAWFLPLVGPVLLPLFRDSFVRLLVSSFCVDPQEH